MAASDSQIALARITHRAQAAEAKLQAAIADKQQAERHIDELRIRLDNAKTVVSDSQALIAELRSELYMVGRV